MNILYALLGLIVFLIVLMIIVLIHEGGHFLVAKKSGILCHEFSIGMGPLIVQKKKGETMFSIRAIPIGGYVAMAGEEVENDILKGIKKVKVVLDSNNVITTLITSLDNPKYKDLQEYELVKYDLVGTKEALPDELYMELKDEEGNINHYTVARNAMANLVKNEEIQIAPYDRAFTNKPLFKRFLSVFAGPFMNFVLALIVFFISGVIYGYADTSSTKVSSVSGAAMEAGVKDNDIIIKIGDTTLSDWSSLGTALSDRTIANMLASDGSINITYKNNENGKELVTKVYPQILIYSLEMVLSSDKTNKVIVGDYGSAMTETKAYKAGLRAGDQIIKIDNSEVTGIDEFVKYLTSENLNESKDVTFYVLRDGKEHGPYTVNTYSSYLLDTQGIPRVKALLGVSTGTTKNIGKLLYMPWVEVGESSLQIFKTLGLFTKKGSGIKITDLSGPVGIFNLFTQLVQSENAFYNILHWTGLLSVNIGLINLLPLPALDGGRIAFLIYEAITKKKPNAKVENTIHNIGFILLMGLFVVIFISDIIKCF